MLRVQRSRRAISAVLTTIVILVASMVMGSGVVVYTTSLFQSGGQQQAVQIQGLKTWVNGTWTGSGIAGQGPSGTSISWGAFAVKNTGDKILSVSSISIRGASVPYANWYADTDPVRVGENFEAQFNYTKNDVFGNLEGSKRTGAGVNPVAGADAANCVQDQVNIPPNMIVIQDTPFASGNSPVCLAQQGGPVSLGPGVSVILYYKLPINLVGPNDAGVSITVSILAGNAPVSQTVRIANP